MRREGYIIEEIILEDNLRYSFWYVVMRRKKTRESHAGRWMKAHMNEVLAEIEKEISGGIWKLGKLSRKKINERGKERDIDCATLYDRIVLNAVMNVVEKHLKRRWIQTSAASIEGRGGLYLVKKIIADYKRVPDAMKIYKYDLRHFYQSISQDFMLWVFKKYFKDKRLIDMMSKCIYALPEGLSIGLRPSQTLGNMLLDKLFDHYLKDCLGVDFYYRYCDDGVIREDTYEKLTEYARAIKEKGDRACLSVKGNEQMWDFNDRPIDFLGYVIYSNGNIRVRKHIKQRFARRWKRVKSKKRKKQLVGSFYGIAKHAKCGNLFKKLTGESMRDFKDFGFVFEASDGKKRWDCQTFPLGNLQNTVIIVEDYERDVVVRGNEMRHLVKFKLEDGTDGKFFTASEELKQMLDKVNDVNGFPFKTTIKRISIGNNKFKYSFT